MSALSRLIIVLIVSKLASQYLRYRDDRNYNEGGEENSSNRKYSRVWLKSTNQILSTYLHKPIDFLPFSKHKTKQNGKKRKNSNLESFYAVRLRYIAEKIRISVFSPRIIGLQYLPESFGSQPRSIIHTRRILDARRFSSFAEEAGICEFNEIIRNEARVYTHISRFSGGWSVRRWILSSNDNCIFHLFRRAERRKRDDDDDDDDSPERRERWLCIFIGRMEKTNVPPRFRGWIARKRKNSSFSSHARWRRGGGRSIRYDFTQRATTADRSRASTRVKSPSRTLINRTVPNSIPWLWSKGGCSASVVAWNSV